MAQEYENEAAIYERFLHGTGTFDDNHMAILEVTVPPSTLTPKITGSISISLYLKSNIL